MQQAFHNKETMSMPIVEKNNAPPLTGHVNLRDASVCEYLSRGLKSGIITLIVNYKKLRVPIRQLNPLSNGWIECTIADELGESDEDAKIVVKNYTNFTLIFGKNNGKDFN